jgi:hypothetical protein
MNDCASLIALARVTLAQLSVILITTLSMRRYANGNARSALQGFALALARLSTGVAVFQPSRVLSIRQLSGHHANMCAVKISPPQLSAHRQCR